MDMVSLGADILWVLVEFWATKESFSTNSRLSSANSSTVETGAENFVAFGNSRVGVGAAEFSSAVLLSAATPSPAFTSFG